MTPSSAMLWRVVIIRANTIKVGGKTEDLPRASSPAFLTLNYILFPSEFGGSIKQCINIILTASSHRHGEIMHCKLCIVINGNEIILSFLTVCVKSLMYLVIIF